MNTADLCLKNAKIPSEKGLIKGCVAVKAGKIISVSKEPKIPDSVEEINLKGKLLLPGVVDAHVHFRDPGLTHKEDFFTGSKAAAAGGVTTVCDMPNNSPYTDSLKKFEKKIEIAESKSLVDFGLHGMLSKPLEEMKKIEEDGAVSLKLYPEITDDSMVQKIKKNDSNLTIHPENPKLLDEEYDSYKSFSESRPKEAEISEVRRIIDLNPIPHVHFCHVTSEESAKIIQNAKSKGNFTCEVTPHHLFLDNTEMKELGTVAKVHPPLRSKKDNSKLLQKLREGFVDIVATDHAPHTKEEKEKNFKEAPAGIVGLETSLPLMFTLVSEGKLSLTRMIEVMCSAPAKIFGLKNEEGVYKGTIQHGSDADLVVIDQKRGWKIKGENFHGKTKFTPFEGMEVLGKPILTLVRGKIVFREGQITGEEGHGRFLKRRL